MKLSSLLSAGPRTALSRTPLSRAGMTALTLLSLLGSLTLPAHAAPRVGTHAGYTRLVFDLPGQNAVTSTAKVASQAVTVKLGATLKSEQGALNAPGVTAYAVSGGTVTVTLAAGHSRASASVLPASGGQPSRLVIDVPTGAARTATPAVTTPAARATPVVRVAATSAPTRPRVVLDPGHGGTDPGMVSRWVTEEDVTLDVALRTRTELLRHGVEVIMTRDSDRHLSANKTQDLDARARMANNGTVSAFVSIHVNAAGASAQGIETFYFGQPLAGSNRSLAVRENGGGSLGEELTRKASSTAQNLLGDILAQAKIAFSRQLAQKVQSQLVAGTGAVSRGVRTDAFYVIRNPTTPAILVELGFGTNPSEGPKLATAAYRDRLAQSLSRAILDFLHTK